MGAPGRPPPIARGRSSRDHKTRLEELKDPRWDPRRRDPSNAVRESLDITRGEGEGSPEGYTKAVDQFVNGSTEKEISGRDLVRVKDQHHPLRNDRVWAAPVEIPSKSYSIRKTTPTVIQPFKKVVEILLETLHFLRDYWRRRPVGLVLMAFPGPLNGSKGDPPQKSDLTKDKAGSDEPTFWERNFEQQKQEIEYLQGFWLNGGGRLLIDPSISLGELFPMIAQGIPIIALGSQATLKSALWGVIHLEKLNQGLGGYRENIGQTTLFRDLSIVLKKSQLGISNSKRHWGDKTQATQIYRENAWNNIPIPWQHYLWLNKHVNWSEYPGEAGYDKFAVDFFKGHSKKAYIVARSLLSKEAFKALGWGKVKQTNVIEQDRLRNTLLEGLKDKTLTGKKGYNKFSLENFDGDPKIAFEVASALLSKKDFKALKWGKQKYINIREEGKFRTILQDGLKDGSLLGEEGYNKFATEYFDGVSFKAFRVARSLLTEKEFKALKWGKQKYTKVQDEAEYRKILREGIAKGDLIGKGGQTKFALEHCKSNALMAYLIANSLLKAEFKKLKWKRVKQAYVNGNGEGSP